MFQIHLDKQIHAQKTALSHQRTRWMTSQLSDVEGDAVLGRINEHSPLLPIYNICCVTMS
jgi:hypothetical protein